MSPSGRERYCAASFCFRVHVGNPSRVILYLVLILAANTKYSINNFFTPAFCDVFGIRGNHKK
ncbi:hypothetical protein GGD55_001260 [Rhizobium giardinii]|uniref:Uncharacterized protein n=1 Tax=Rhizobium giardinii TaxID=56731 RepID=A0A7W8U886_9HYPH|nr:hypothetical protein [Rhizobium giardinii]